MNVTRYVGLILFIIGLVLFAVGMNASHSVADQVSNTFTGRFTHATTWYIIGGLVCGLVGIIALITGGGGRPRSA